MAIAYRSSTTGQHDGSVAASTHSVTLNKPTGLATGDCLVVTISGREDDGTGRLLSSEVSFTGFTLVTENAAYSSAVVSRKWVFKKVVSDATSEPASYTFTATGNGTNKINLAGIAAAFSGVDTSNSVDASSTFDGETTSTTLTFNSVTTSTANTMLVMCGVARRGTPTATFNDGTEIAESAQAGTAGVGGGTTVYMGYLAQASAGASGDKTATLTEIRENDGLIVALKEAAPTGLTITSVTPSSFDSGIAGIVIAGSGFGASQGSSTVDIGGQAQTVTAWSNTSITITSARGSNSMGSAQLKVTIR